jgi:peroxiredoxin
MREKPSWIPYAVAAGIAAALVLFLWVNLDRLTPVEPGSKAPRFRVFDLDGAPKSLSDFRGKVLLVNVWATWCPPCQEEMPSMERLFREISDEDFEILAISVDAPPGEEDEFGRPGGDLKRYAETRDLTFTILHDPTGKIQEAYRTTGVPESFVLDRNGVIKKKIAGATEWDAPENVELIRRLLGE